MEEWRDVVGYEDLFSVSDKGNLFSKRSLRILKQHTRRNGYRTVATKIGGRKGKSICFRIHRVVAEAFLPNPLNLPVINHINGVKDDNNIQNLEWSSYSDNTKHAHEMGLARPPCTKSLQKLSEEEVQFILEKYKPFCRRFGSRALGRKFNINKSSISRIVRNSGYMAA